MSASDYTEMPTGWKKQILKNPSSLTAATTQPRNNAFKTHMCITHISWSYFFPHFGHCNIAIKSSLGLSAWFRYNMCEGNVSDEGLFKTPFAPLHPISFALQFGERKSQVLPLNRHTWEVCFCLNGEGEVGTSSWQGSVRTGSHSFSAPLHVSARPA